MDRSTEKLDSSHNRMTFTMQMMTERQEWQRTFPNPLPKGYRLAHKWDPTEMKLTVWPEPIGGEPLAPKPAENDAAYTEVTALNDADLQTKAGELGVATKGKTRARLVADVVAAMKAKQGD